MTVTVMKNCMFIEDFPWKISTYYHLNYIIYSGHSKQTNDIDFWFLLSTVAIMWAVTLMTYKKHTF